MDTPQTTTTHKTYQERGYCSRPGYARIREVLRACCWLYNHSLEQRKNTYLTCGKGMTMYRQMKGLTQLRKEQQFWRRNTSKTCSHCGEVRKEKLADYRTFVCLSCRHTEDRDLNAAKNIQERGWEYSAQPKAG